mgnify:FL=1
MGYIVVKEITNGEGKAVPVGSQIDIVRDVIFINGGMLDTFYQFYFADLIDHEEKNGFHYLKPQKAIYNKL